SEQLSKTDRETFEWTDDFNRVMKQLVDWKSSDEPSQEDYLNEKAVVFRALLELAPTERLQAESLEKLIRFLDEFSLDRVGPAEWFWHVEAILHRAGGSDKKLKNIALTKLSASKIPVLALYATLISDGL
ncbi:MAG TPA: hypothetical protein VKJ45_12130, partial [Blastocatellia bacterium]|nr:hypothetical protein [Blastocatellia bacterium]